MGKIIFKLVVFIVALSLFCMIFADVSEARRRGGGSPPPPPPPCPTRQAGCYDLSDNRADSGSLAQDSFGFYLSETAYIPGGCSASAAKTVDQAKILNPDDHVGACGCVAGADFDNQAEAAKRCCGDDSQDCAATSKNALCVIDSDYRNSRWVLPAAAKFDIIYVGCQNREKLFDGNSWIDCLSFSKQALGSPSREYLCTGGQGPGTLAECCGPSACLSKTNGRRMQSGGSVEAQDATHYCASDRKFTTDLDIKDQASCDNAKNLDGAPANFKWTGTKCCSEADDRKGVGGNAINEYYNDETGGCWDSKPVMSISFVDDKQDVVNFEGQFHGCAIAESLFNPGNDEYLSLSDKHTGDALISDAPYCTTDPQQSYFCSFREKWLPTQGQDRTQLKTAPFAVQNTQTTSQSECCAPSSCWDGQRCVNDQSISPTSSNALEGYRCMLGNWIEATPKSTPDGRAFGYCPNLSQCLVNPAGNSADNNNPSKNPQCISSGQYQADNLCFLGNWSTRTTAIALELLSMKPEGDFTLSCDKTESTLSQLDYLTPSGKTASSYFGQNANNVCILQFQSNTLIGSSFNAPFTNDAAFDLFGVQDCNNAQAQDGNYHECDASSHLLYNKKMESVIYSKSSLSIDEPNLVEAFFAFLKDPLRTLTSALKQKLTQPSFPITSYGEGITKFDRIYIAKKGTKEVFGVLQSDSAVVQYKNLPGDQICGFAKEFTRQKGGSNSGIECRQDGSSTYLLLQGNQLTNFRPEIAWSDVTSKVRLD